MSYTPSSPLFPVDEQTVATHTIYLALGSNLGDRRGHLSTALQRLREIIDIHAISSVYETEPVGYLESAATGAAELKQSSTSSGSFKNDVTYLTQMLSFPSSLNGGTLRGQPGYQLKK